MTTTRIFRGRAARVTRAAIVRAYQHFLRTSAAAELVRDACLRPSDVVVDLGAGTGRLTAPLAHAARRVVAVELDPRLARGLRGRWPNVQVIEGDAAAVPLRASPSGSSRTCRSVAPTTCSTTCLTTPPPRSSARISSAVGRGPQARHPVAEHDVERRLGRVLRDRGRPPVPAERLQPPPSVDAGVLVFRRRAAPRAGRRARRLPRVRRPRLPPRPALRVPARELDAHQWAQLWRSS